MTQVIVSSDARSDADGILAYLQREAGAAVAARYATRFRDVVRKLGHRPKMGAPRRKLGPAVRVLAVSPYLVFYEYAPAPDTVTLLRILHERRNITASLLPC